MASAQVGLAAVDGDRGTGDIAPGSTTSSSPGCPSTPRPTPPPLGGRDFVVLASRGGGYSEGTSREGWDHAEPWLPHAILSTGLEPRFITAELTLAEVTPAMAELIPPAAKSLAAAEQAIDGLWSPASALA